MYPVVSVEEVKQALIVLDMNIKTEVKSLTIANINKIVSNLSSLDEEVQGFASLLCYYFASNPVNVKHIITSGLVALRDCSASPAAFARQYSILTLAKIAEVDHNSLQKLNIIEQIAGFAGQSLSEESYDAPSVLIAKYFAVFVDVEQIHSKTALQLLIYLCQRIHGSLGEEDFGQIFTVLQALQAVLQFTQFKQKALAARIPTTLITFLSSLLNSNVQPSELLVINIFRTMELVFTDLYFPQEFTENEEFLHFLEEETASMSQMDIFGIIRYYTVPEKTISQDITRQVMKFFAQAMRFRSFGEDAYNHMENKGSKSTVQIVEFITFVMSNSAYNESINTSIFEVVKAFCQFRHIIEKINSSQFLYIVRDYMNYIINKSLIKEHTVALTSLFEMLQILSSDSSNYIISTKLFFEDFSTTQKLALKLPGENLFQLLDLIVELADLTAQEDFLYQQNLNALFSVCQLSISCMPFLNASTSLELLRKKFKSVRPSRVPPCSLLETRALIHLINQRRSIKFAAIIPFGLRLLCKLDEQAVLIVKKQTLQNLNDLIDWVCSEDNQFSRVNFSLINTRQPEQEVSDETLLMQNKAVQGFIPEVIQEVLELLHVLVFNKIVDGYQVANILNCWVHITSVDQVKAQEGAILVRAICKSLGSNFSKVKGNLNKNILRLVE